jgi:Fe-S-cluster containining protein
MKNFVDSKYGKYFFSNCNSCEANCCSGSHGSVSAQILLEDFELVYKNFPILFTKGELGFIKPMILLSDGINHCKYIENYRCTIYNDRPSICRAYPLSPNLDNNTYIDLNCPAVSTTTGDLIVEYGNIAPNYQHHTLEDYQQKYINTHQHIDPYNKEENLEYLLTIKDTHFYKMKSDFDDKYMKLHIESLKNL